MAAAKSGFSSRSSGNKSRKRLYFGLAAFGLAGTLLWTAAGVARYSQTAMPPSAADFALVLGARSLDSGPLPVYRARIDYALKLYREGKVKKILFTGGVNVPERRSQAEVAKRYAVERGLPETDILLEESSMRTLENLREAVKVLPNPESTTVLVVSDPYHLKRAMLMAKDLGLRAHPAPVPRTLLRSPWNRGKFLFRETVAYLYYWTFRR